MAKIKKTLEGGVHYYPATIMQAVKDPSDGKNVKEKLTELNNEVFGLTFGNTAYGVTEVRPGRTELSSLYEGVNQGYVGLKVNVPANSVIDFAIENSSTYFFMYAAFDAVSGLCIDVNKTDSGVHLLKCYDKDVIVVANAIEGGSYYMKVHSPNDEYSDTLLNRSAVNDIMGYEELIHFSNLPYESGYYNNKGVFLEDTAFRSFSIDVVDVDKLHFYAGELVDYVLNVFGADDSFVENLAMWKNINGLELNVADSWAKVTVSIINAGVKETSCRIAYRSRLNNLVEGVNNKVEASVSAEVADTVSSGTVSGSLIPTVPVSLNKGDNVTIRLVPSSTGLTARLKMGDNVVKTLINDDSHQATEEVFSFTLDQDVDSLILWSYGTIEYSIDRHYTVVDLLLNGNPVIPIAYKKGGDILVTILKDIVGGKGVPSRHCSLLKGRKYRVIASTDNNGFSITLKKDGVAIQSVIDSPDMAPVSDYSIDFTCDDDVDTITLWSYGNIDFTLYELNATIEAADAEGARQKGVCIDNLLDDYHDVPVSAHQSIILKEDTQSLKNAFNAMPSIDSVLNGEMIRFFHLDCGRKYFSPANIKAILAKMHENRFNTFIVHFSEDQGFRFKLDDMNIVVDGVNYDLSTAIGRGISINDYNVEPSDAYITQSEMDEIIEVANSYGIDVIPSFDMPSHMGAICQAFPQFAFDSRTLDFRSSSSVKFMLAIIDKYATYFKSRGSKIWNIGCDELSADVSSGIMRKKYFGFLELAVDKIQSIGLIPAMYNDYITKDCGISKNVIVFYWTRSSYKDANEIEDAGYRILNYSYDLYWALGRYKTVRHEGFDVYQAFQSTKIKNPLGAGWCCWCDNADYDGTDGGDAMITDTSDIFVNVGNVLCNQSKKLVVTLGAIEIAPGSFVFIDVAVPEDSDLVQVVSINDIGLNYISYTNLDCKVDVRKKSLDGGNIRICLQNNGEEPVSIDDGTILEVRFI